MAQQFTQAAGSGQTIKTHPLLDVARDLVITDQKASISYVQRKLKVGYNDAATLLDTLELEGVVSQLGPDFTRTVLATKTAGNGCNAPVMAQQDTPQKQLTPRAEHIYPILYLQAIEAADNLERLRWKFLRLKSKPKSDHQAIWAGVCALEQDARNQLRAATNDGKLLMCWEGSSVIKLEHKAAA